MTQAQKKVPNLFQDYTTWIMTFTSKSIEFLSGSDSFEYLLFDNHVKFGLVSLLGENGWCKLMKGFVAELTKHGVKISPKFLSEKADFYSFDAKIIYEQRVKYLRVLENFVEELIRQDILQNVQLVD